MVTTRLGVLAVVHYQGQEDNGRSRDNLTQPGLLWNYLKESVAEFIEL